MLKSLSVFDSTTQMWPEFEQKFKYYCRAKKILYVIEQDRDDVPSANEMTAAKSIREAQAQTREDDDAKAVYSLTCKLSADAFALVRSASTCYDMMKILREHFHSESTTSLIGRLDKLLDIQYKPLLNYVSVLN